MKSYSPALLAVALAGTLLAGCTSTPGNFASAASAEHAPSAAPSASEVPAKTEFVAALQKTHKATYRFAVKAAAPDKQKIQGNGSFDPKAKRLSTTTKVSGGKLPGTVQRIVVGTDLYNKAPKEGTWVHLDMKRIKKSTYLKVDMTDPLGLGIFAGAVDSVRRTGAHAYQGTFETSPSGKESFLPIGAPSIVIFGGSGAFTATTDAQGFVTRIDVTLTAGEILKMTTVFSAQGKPVAIKKPNRVGEAYDFYYD